MRRAARVVAMAVVVGAALGGCVSPEWRPTGHIEPLTAAASESLPATPLLVVVTGAVVEGRREQGAGSGVLVHERILLTARHITGENAQVVQLFTASSGRGVAARVERVIVPEEDREDWALLVLDSPLTGLAAKPAVRLASSGGPPLGAGVPLVHAGFAITGGPLDREPLLIRTIIAAPPPGTGLRPGVICARDARGGRSLVGLSGGPVFAAEVEGGPPVLIGLHSGNIRVTLAGIECGRFISVQPVPVEEIEAAISELEEWTARMAAEDAGAAPLPARAPRTRPGA